MEDKNLLIANLLFPDITQTPEDMEKALAFLKNREYQPTNESASA